MYSIVDWRLKWLHVGRSNLMCLGVLSRSQSSRCLALTAVENPSCQQWAQQCHRTQHSLFFLTCPGHDTSKIIRNTADALLRFCSHENSP